MNQNHGSHDIHAQNLGECDITPPSTIKGANVTADTRIAVIAPLTGNGHGFDWGTDRKHFVLNPNLPAEVYATMLEYYHDANFVSSSDDEDRAGKWATIATEAILSGKAPSSEWDIAVVDASIGVTDDWPSAGQGDCWSDDVFLCIADYLSYAAFSLLIGKTADDYTFPARSDLDEDAAKTADEYLPSGWDA